MSTEMTELVEAVKAHANEHYEDGGWDVIVECWSDEEIAEAVKGTKTTAGAIRKMRSVVGIYADRQADAINSAF